MRRILLVKSRGLDCPAIKTLILNLFSDVTLDEIDCEQASVYLRSKPSPDLIVYAPRSVGPLGKRFQLLKMLAGRAKILVYSTFQQDERYLFDYLAAGVNGILSKSAHVNEHQRALDTVMRGDSYVDAGTRGTMLKSIKAVRL